MPKIKIEKTKYNKYVQGMEQLRKDCEIANKDFYAYLRYFTKRFEEFHGLVGDEINFEKVTEGGIIT